MKTKLIIKSNIDVLMEKQGLSPEKLADMTGLSRPTIYNIRANRIYPTLKTLSILANGLGVDHTELLRTEKMKAE